MEHVGPFVPSTRERSGYVEVMSLRARSICEALRVGVGSPVDSCFVLAKASYRLNRELGLTVASSLGTVLEEQSAVDEPVSILPVLGPVEQLLMAKHVATSATRFNSLHGCIVCFQYCKELEI